MPDISMCGSVCPKSRECRRHEDSGTVASEWRQSWLAGQGGDECPHFWPVANPYIAKDAAP